MQIRQNNESIDLLELGKSLLRHALAIVLITIISGVLSLLFALVCVTPKYEANALFYVNNSTSAINSNASSINSADLSAAHTLVNTYVVILKSRMVLTEIIDKAELDYTVKQLDKMIKAEAVNDTEVMSVVVRSSSPTEAERIANTIMEVLPEKISDVVVGSSVRVVDYAVVPAEKSSPSLKKYLLIGMLLGFFIACGIFCFLELYDDVIKNTSYLKQNFDVPVLAVIPDMQEEDKNGYRAYYYRSPSRSRKAGA